MADKLTHKERSAFNRALEHPELFLILFSNVKEPYWFDAFQEEGLLKPENSPQPRKIEDGYVSVPNWPILTYLVNSSVALQYKKNAEHAPKYLKLIKDVTQHAKDYQYSNYRTWWQFSKILEKIPSRIIQEKDLDVIDYWLDDRNGSDLIAEQIGAKWLVGLLNSDDEHSLCLSRKILSVLYQVTIVEDNHFEGEGKNALFRFDNHDAQKITKEVAKISGEKLGEDAVSIFDERLKNVINELKNDTWSSLWHPAIEDHEQNEHRDEANNILVQAYRDSLDGFIEINVEKAGEHIKEMLGGECQTIHRLAISSISNNYDKFKNLTNKLLKKDFFSTNYRHEMWHFLYKNYQSFNANQQHKALEIIDDISINDRDGVCHNEYTAYNKVCWLDAIKSYGEEEKKLYEDNLQLAKTGEPDHPDFSSYMFPAELVSHESPFSIDELGGLSTRDLVEKLNNYKNPEIWHGPGVSGLCVMFNLLIKRDPRKFYLELDQFVGLELPYINEIIRAYSDLWADKYDLPWGYVWEKLLKFFETIINKSDFWGDDNKLQSDSSVSGRHQIVSGISKMLKDGANPGDSALSTVPIEDAKKIIFHLLCKETGSEFSVSENVVVIARSNPRGRCLEALIQLAFRSCRLADEENNNNHSVAWANFESRFDAELDRADTENPEYEFVTLVTYRLPYFLYMSEEWVLSNLDRVFDQSCDLKWACAMQGWAYVNFLHLKIYQHLATHGDFIKALDAENIIGLVKEKVIEYIAVAFLQGVDNENGLMDTLIERNKHEEIHLLIRKIRAVRDEINPIEQKKIFELFPKILANIDFLTDNGKKIASQLCAWAEFIDSIDGKQKEWLLEIAPYAETNQAPRLLENILRLSEKQPYESQEIWLEMLKEYLYPHPEDVIKKLLKNIVSHGHEGKQKARDVTELYFKHGATEPSEWLDEVIADNNN